MSVLNSRDYRRLLETIRELNAPCQPEEFPARAIVAVSRLVASEYTAYNAVDLARGRIVAVVEPGSPSPAMMAALLEPHLSEHPLVSRGARGELTLDAISDFYDVRAWHQTALYNEFYRAFGIEDQLALRLNGAKGELIALTLQRGNRSFSARERELLRLLRPHLDNALVLMRATSQTPNAPQRAPEGAAPARGYALVGDDAALLFCDRQASQFLFEFWNSDALPPDLRAWLGAPRAALSEDLVLRVRRAERVLNVLRGEPSPKGTLLIFEEISSFDPLMPLRRLGLTARQSEVLLCLARGESNAEIAARLHLSLHTTKRHLETIYERLNVHNRAAAAHRALQVLGEAHL